jgi:hypothetical protein
MAKAVNMIVANGPTSDNSNQGSWHIGFLTVICIVSVATSIKMLS